MKAVRFDEYGPVSVLDVRDVPIPEPGPGQVLIRVKAAGINPGEAKIREGELHERWPATFPSGQGSDFAGVVERLGPGVTAVAERDDDVIGWVDTRSSQAEYVVAEAGEPGAAGRPACPGRSPARSRSPASPRGPWCARSTSSRVTPSSSPGPRAASARSRSSSPDAQGATVIGLAGPSNHDWLKRHGVLPWPTATASAASGSRERRPRRPDRRVPRHVRRRLRGAGAERPQGEPGPRGHHRPLRRRRRSTASRPTATPPARAPRPWRRWPA